MPEFDREQIIERIRLLAAQKNESLNHALTSCGFKDFAVNLRKGSNPTVEKFFTLANYFDVSISYILTGEEQDLDRDSRELLANYAKLSDRDKIRILERVKTLSELNQESKSFLKFESPENHPPVKMREMTVYLQSASAGAGNFLENDESSQLMSFREDSLPRNAGFGIKISGDSMEPKISDGDIVWVKEQKNIENGQIGIFVLNGDAFCKKLVLEGNRCSLVSLNKKYKPIRVLEEDALFTVGRVLF